MNLGRGVPKSVVGELFFRPSGARSLSASYPGLAPLRQAQGRLWAAFFRRFAAKTVPIPNFAFFAKFGMEILGRRFHDYVARTSYVDHSHGTGGLVAQHNVING
jgi:hypothetical protein